MKQGDKTFRAYNTEAERVMGRALVIRKINGKRPLGGMPTKSTNIILEMTGLSFARCICQPEDRGDEWRKSLN